MIPENTDRQTLTLALFRLLFVGLLSTATVENSTDLNFQNCYPRKEEKNGKYKLVNKEARGKIGKASKSLILGI